jgi:hypothetical protein
LREDFLHFCWRWRRFDAADLSTTDGQALEILHPGEPNGHAGPDFFNARIRLDGTLWAGNVELHLRASDWLAHRHGHDRAYDNVVLHVVLDEDQPMLRPGGERLPCLALRRRLPPRLLETWWRLEHERRWIPCAGLFARRPALVWMNWLDRLLVERLERKTVGVAAALEACDQHWDEAFYRLLARSFGLKVNTDPFEALARALPLNLLTRHRNNLFQLEALLFGQAGLLDPAFTEDYPRALAKEYRFLKHKYGLTPLDGGQWKFLRLRPAGFPSLRLAQFAALFHRGENLFSEVLEAGTVRELELLFTNVPGEYWRTHYQLDRPSAPKVKPPGLEFVHLLLINTVAPALFHYGKIRHQPDHQAKAIRLLEELPAEDNAVMDGWKALGATVGQACQSQALLHLKTEYCDVRRCLECAVGHALLK